MAPGERARGRVTAAVLCRKRSQFAAVEVALRRRGLPVEVVGLGGLLTTPEVVDVVALLEAVHDPSRGDALVRLLTGPRLNLGAADLHALGSRAADLARLEGALGSRRRASAAEDTESGLVVVEGTSPTTARSSTRSTTCRTRASLPRTGARSPPRVTHGSRRSRGPCARCAVSRTCRSRSSSSRRSGPSASTSRP